jgi:hypothetical protein
MLGPPHSKGHLERFSFKTFLKSTFIRCTTVSFKLRANVSLLLSELNNIYAVVIVVLCSVEMINKLFYSTYSILFYTALRQQYHFTTVISNSAP